MFTCLPVFPSLLYDYSCLLCLPLHVYPFLLVFTYVCYCLLTITYVYQCLLCFYLCLPLLLVLVYLCLPMFSRVYLCVLLFACVYLFTRFKFLTYVYNCLLLITYVYQCFLVQCYLWLPIFTHTCLLMFYSFTCLHMITAVYLCWHTWHSRRKSTFPRKNTKMSHLYHVVALTLFYLRCLWHFNPCFCSRVIRENRSITSRPISREMSH